MQAHTNKQLLYVRITQSSALSAQTDLGGEDGLPRLGDHVKLLDGGGQVAGGAQVGQAHEAALCPHVIVRPVVPLVRCVRGCKRKSSGFTTGTSCISCKIITQLLLLVCQHLLRWSHVRDYGSETEVTVAKLKLRLIIVPQDFSHRVQLAPVSETQSNKDKMFVLGQFV